MDAKQKARLLARVLEDMRGSPNSGAVIIFHYQDNAGARGTLPPWNTCRKPLEQLTHLITGPMNLGGKEIQSVDFQLVREEPGEWVVLFHSVAEKKEGFWEHLEGMTRSQAHQEATRRCPRQPGNWPRKGFSLLRLAVPLVRETPHDPDQMELSLGGGEVPEALADPAPQLEVDRLGEALAANHSQLVGMAVIGEDNDGEI